MSLRPTWPPDAFRRQGDGRYRTVSWLPTTAMSSPAAFIGSIILRALGDARHHR
jgi:hypothetical protein